jgi:hypothetical protein
MLNDYRWHNFIYMHMNFDLNTILLGILLKWKLSW